jgi:hypothetical protein
MLSSVRPFSRMGGMAVACKNVISPSILTYGWHGGSDVLVCRLIFTYGWHGGRVKYGISPSI